MPNTRFLKPGTTLLKNVGAAFLFLCYPPLCIACQKALDSHADALCSACSLEMEPIDPLQRCRRCFGFLDDHEQEGCEKCSRLPWPLLQLGAVFPYRGAPARLLKRLKYGNRRDLGKVLGAYLVVQWSRLEWPKPDAIIPMPISRLRRWTRGYNQCELLGESLAAILEVPLVSAIGRRSGDWSQAGLDPEQRQQLTTASFYLHPNASQIRNKNVLIIDDVFTTGKTLEQCAAVVLEAGPRSIYGLTLCQA